MERVDEFATRAPALPLRGLAAWYVGYRQVGVDPTGHRGLPSPYLTLIVTLDEPLTVTMGGAPSTHHTLVGGLHSTPALITHGGRQSGIQVGLSPLGARTLLGLPAGEIGGVDVEATDLLGPIAAEVHDRVRAAASWPARFAVLDELLLRLARRSPNPAVAARVSDEVAWAWRHLIAAGGAPTVAHLAEQTGWSSRHLGNRFHAEIGLSPKVAARVVRFDRARRVLQNRVAAGRAADLAELAVSCGYFDQAHLDRDFRAFAGCSPSQWLAEEFRNVQVRPAVVDHDEVHDR